MTFDEMMAGMAAMYQQNGGAPIGNLTSQANPHTEFDFADLSELHTEKFFKTPFKKSKDGESLLCIPQTRGEGVKLLLSGNFSAKYAGKFGLSVDRENYVYVSVGGTDDQKYKEGMRTIMKDLLSMDMDKQVKTLRKIVQKVKDQKMKVAARIDKGTLTGFQIMKFGTGMQEMAGEDVNLNIWENPKTEEKKADNDDF